MTGFDRRKSERYLPEQNREACGLFGVMNIRREEIWWRDSHNCDKKH